LFRALPKADFTASKSRKVEYFLNSAPAPDHDIAAHPKFMESAAFKFAGISARATLQSVGSFVITVLQLDPEYFLHASKFLLSTDF
jgi:hypothetical protein